MQRAFVSSHQERYNISLISRNSAVQGSHFCISMNDKRGDADKTLFAADVNRIAPVITVCYC